MNGSFAPDANMCARTKRVVFPGRHRRLAASTMRAWARPPWPSVEENVRDRRLRHNPVP